MARRWSRILVEAIDPVVAGSPFQAGQGGEWSSNDSPGPGPRSGASVVWCGGYDEVIEAYPHLARPGVEAEENWCFDLTVDIGGGGRLLDVRLEHGDLVAAFVAMGRTDDASAASALLGRPADAAVPELAALLSRLFTASEPTTTMQP